jgi:hypothetical protein
MSSQSVADDELSYDGESRDDDESGIADETSIADATPSDEDEPRNWKLRSGAALLSRAFLPGTKVQLGTESVGLYISNLYCSRTGMIASMMTSCRCRRVSTVVVVVVRSGWKVQQVGMFFQYGLLDLLEGR